MNTSQDLPCDAINLVKAYLLDLQNNICLVLQNIEKKSTFTEDVWSRPLGGGGITRILSSGTVFAKLGVNFSHIFGSQLPTAVNAAQLGLQDQSLNCTFHAMGVSLVSHPENPYVPTAHCNVRFFVIEKADGSKLWWFGGGFDLTPYYGFREDCIHWHTTAAKACRPFGQHIYPQFKEDCDKYFYLQHRHEARGIGGLFFDHFNQISFEYSFALMQSIGSHFIPAYYPILTKRQDLAYGEREKKFQHYRRGRYVEFNLIYDRGTLFGLQSGGRPESILMSLPPEVSWIYNWEPETGSEEAKLYADFLPARNWLEEA